MEYILRGTTPLNIAIFCTVVLGLLLFGLGLNVSITRKRHAKGIGHDLRPDDPVHHAVRAHGNTADYGGGVWDLLIQHLEISGTAVLIACVVAWPVGILLGRRGSGGGFAVVLSNVTQAIPLRISCVNWPMALPPDRATSGTHGFHSKV